MSQRAACILAALGNDNQETDAEFIRAFVGARYIAKATNDIENIRRLLTPAK